MSHAEDRRGDLYVYDINTSRFIRFKIGHWELNFGQRHGVAGTGFPKLVVDLTIMYYGVA